MTHYAAPDNKALIDSATAHLSVTKSDDDTYSGYRAVYVGGAGNLVVEMGGSDVTYVVAAGQILPISPRKVKAATTATGIVLWA